MFNDLCSMNVINFTRTDTENKSQIYNYNSFAVFLPKFFQEDKQKPNKHNIHSQCLYLKVVEDFVFFYLNVLFN